MAAQRSYDMVILQIPSQYRSVHLDDRAALMSTVASSGALTRSQRRSI